MVSSRRIADDRAESGPVRRAVRRALRDPGAPRRRQRAPALADRRRVGERSDGSSVLAGQSSAVSPSLGGRPHARSAPRRRGSRSTRRRFRCPPRRCRPPVCAATARTSSTSRAAPPPSARRVRIPLRPNSDRDSRSGSSAASPNSAAKPASATLAALARLGSGSNVRASVKPSRMPGPVIAGADVERDEHRALVGQRLTRAAVGPPERRVVGGVGLAQVALRPVLGRAPGTRAAAAGRTSMPARCSGGIATTTARAVNVAAVRGDGQACRRVPFDAAHRRRPAPTRSPSSSAIRTAICWVPPGKRSCWAPPSTSSMRPRPPAALT